MGILVAFHPLLVIARFFSFDLFLKTLTLKCWFLKQNLSLIAGVKFRFEKLPPISVDRPFVIVSNHQGTYDIPMLIVYFWNYQLRFISKRELAKWLPSVSYAVRHNRSALIDRNNRSQALQAIQEAARQASKDNAGMCIFPEGTRARDGKMGKFKTAGFNVVIKEMANAVIIPVAVTGSWKLLRYHFFPVPYGTTFTLTAFSPIELGSKDPNEVLQEIENKIRGHVEKVETENDKPKWVS